MGGSMPVERSTVGTVEGRVVAPLAGLRVLDLTSTVAGAIATMLLRDFGAEVTLVEPPGGHPLAAEPGFRVWGFGKHRLVADPRTARGRRRVAELARTADVLVEDLGPGQAERLGLLGAAVHEANPHLIHVAITACGPRGPWRDLPPDEALVAALSGTMRRQPSFREGPSYFVLPLCSYAAALLALHGIGAALFARERTGMGARVETSLLAGALAMSSATFAVAERGEPAPPLTRHPLGQLPLYRLYQTQDGRWLHLGGLTARFWPRVALAVGRPELISDPRFQNAPRMATEEDRRALMQILAEEFDRRPFAEWDRILDEHDVPYGPALTVDEFLHDPQLRHQGLVVTVEHPEVGHMERVGPVIRFERRGGVDYRPSPASLRSAPSPASGRGKGGDGTGVAEGLAPRPGQGEGLAGAAPLAGVRVLDASGYIAGAYGGAFLADLGADVIKVEGPEGDGLRGPGGGFLSWNRGKRGVCLDLRTDDGRAAYLRLAAQADVVLENMRPGVADRLGVGYEAVRAVNPRIVYCYVSAYGSTGPYRHKPGFDPILQARSGIERAQGGLEMPPVFLVPPVTDNTAAMLNALGILLALYHRDRTGEGLWVETSLLAAAALLQSDSLTAYEGRPPRAANDREHLGPHALRRLYRCRDGWLMLACRDERDWRALCAALGRPEWRADPRFATPEARAGNQRALAEALAARLAVMPLARVVRALHRRRVPCAPATGVCEGLDDPQLVENGYVVSFAHPVLGTVRQAAGLVQVNGQGSACARPAPLLGEHTREVLAEAGFTRGEIERLLASAAARETNLLTVH
jgi:crotonobetainyl-CoA:carnitine CoA-transferase CaiB-like acyl-CoA transferase